MAQVVEHILGKDEVPGSNPGISSLPSDISEGFFVLEISFPMWYNM